MRNSNLVRITVVMASVIASFAEATTTEATDRSLRALYNSSSNVIAATVTRAVSTRETGTISFGARPVSFYKGGELASEIGVTALGWPAMPQVGATVFLFIQPIPPKKDWGADLAAAGIASRFYALWYTGGVATDVQTRVLAAFNSGNAQSLVNDTASLARENLAVWCKEFPLATAGPMLDSLGSTAVLPSEVAAIANAWRAVQPDPVLAASKIALLAPKVQGQVDAKAVFNGIAASSQHQSNLIAGIGSDLAPQRIGSIAASMGSTVPAVQQATQTQFAKEVNFEVMRSFGEKISAEGDSVSAYTLFQLARSYNAHSLDYYVAACSKTPTSTCIGNFAVLVTDGSNIIRRSAWNGLTNLARNPDWKTPATAAAIQPDIDSDPYVRPAQAAALAECPASSRRIQLLQTLGQSATGVAAVKATWALLMECSSAALTACQAIAASSAEPAASTFASTVMQQWNRTCP
jgi:hypothetical protein